MKLGGKNAELMVIKKNLQAWNFSTLSFVISNIFQTMLENFSHYQLRQRPRILKKLQGSNQYVQR